MVGTRWTRTVGVVAAGALSLALVACGPSSTESGSLQSVGAPAPAAVASTTATAAQSSPATPTSTVAAPATATVAVSVTGGSALAQVSTSSGVPAAGTVSFAVDGAAAGDVAVTGNQASVVIPAGLPVGDHTVTARFVSTDTAAVTGADGTATFAVAKAASSITASVGKDSIRYGDQASFDISVQASGAPAGADLTGHVTVLDGTETIEEGDTDAVGPGVAALPQPGRPGREDLHGQLRRQRRRRGVDRPAHRADHPDQRRHRGRLDRRPQAGR